MNREKFAWCVSIILLALMTLHLPHGLAQRDNDYAFVRTLVDIHRHVVDNYVDPVEGEKLETGAVNGMLGQLDPFTAYIPPANQKDFDHLLEGSFEGVGVKLRETADGVIEVVTPIEDSPAYKAGVQAGDIILAVNGESLAGVKLEDVTKKIGGKLGSRVTLRVRHFTGQEAELVMARQEIVVPTTLGYARRQDGTWDYWVSDEPRIAYVRFTGFTSNTFENLKPILMKLIDEKMQGLILDLRWNPGGRLDEAKKIVNLFIDHGIIVSTEGRRRPKVIEYATPDGALPARFPMAVLVNEHSASASEIVAGSLQDNQRALVVGTRSYGKGSVQEVIPLEGNNGELKLTVAHYYLPSGRLLHRTKKNDKDYGVPPQIEVKLDEATEKKVLTERDEKENFRKPLRPNPPPATTTPAAAVTGNGAATPTTSPTSQPAGPTPDAQLQAATNALVGFVIFADQHPGTSPGDLPTIAAERRATTQPTTSTQPATAPRPAELPLNPTTNPAHPPGPSATQPNLLPTGK